MAEYNRHFRTICALFCCLFQRDRIMSLLDGINGVPCRLERLHGLDRIFVIRPIDALFGTQSRLVQLLVRWTATYAT